MGIVTGKVRFSYLYIFEPRKTMAGDEKYSATILIPKTDITTYNRITEEINRVLAEAKGDIFNGVIPANIKTPIHDGDGLKQNGEQYDSECKGHWVMNASSNIAPEVVDAQCNPIVSKNDIYSGCYGRVSLRFYAYNQKGNKGVGCGLGNVQKLEDGQPLNGRTSAAEDFGTPINQMQNMGQIPQNMGQIDPITGQPLSQPQPTLNNIYGVN